MLKGLKTSHAPNIVNETEYERDLRRARQYRHKIENFKGVRWVSEEKALKALEAKYGVGFDRAKEPPRKHYQSVRFEKSGDRGP